MYSFLLLLAISLDSIWPETVIRFSLSVPVKRITGTILSFVICRLFCCLWNWSSYKYQRFSCSYNNGLSHLYSVILSYINYKIVSQCVHWLLSFLELPNQLADLTIFSHCMLSASKENKRSSQNVNYQNIFTGGNNSDENLIIISDKWKKKSLHENWENYYGVYHQCNKAIF